MNIRYNRDSPINGRKIKNNNCIVASTNPSKQLQSFIEVQFLNPAMPKIEDTKEIMVGGQLTNTETVLKSYSLNNSKAIIKFIRIHGSNKNPIDAKPYL